MSVVSTLFTEQMRPQTLEQALLVDRIKNLLQNELNSPNGIISNLLFFGSVPGCGKSTMTRIIAKGHDVKFIDCSSVGIDAVREDIQTFASQFSLEHPENPIKIVILEECDGFTTEAWKAMRATVEKFAANIRFVANCNYIEKVPDPIRSRFTCIQFEPINNEEKEQLLGLYMGRTAKLLERLGIEYTEEALKDMIMETFPDYRSVLNTVQQLFNSGVKKLDASSVAAAFDFDKLFTLLMSNPNPYETYLTVRDEFGSKVDDCIKQIGEKFPDFLKKNREDLVHKLPMIVITTAEHQDMMVRAINKNVVLQSLVFKIQNILSN